MAKRPSASSLQRNDCTVDIELSSLSRYANTYFARRRHRAHRGLACTTSGTFELVSRGGARQKVKIDTPARSIEDSGEIMIDNFLAVVSGTARPLVSGADVLDSVVLIDECYARRQRYDMPWHEPGGRCFMVERVLITGAGGFIGGRIAEVLHCSEKISVRAAVRRWSSAARIGRFPMEIVLADVTDLGSCREAMRGVSAVVHCAVGQRCNKSRRHEERARGGIPGGRQAGGAPEHGSSLRGSNRRHRRDHTPARTGNEYGDSKIDTEERLLGLCRPGPAGRGPPAELCLWSIQRKLDCRVRKSNGGGTLDAAAGVL